MYSNPSACRVGADGTLYLMWPGQPMQRLGRQPTRLFALLFQIYGGAMPRELLAAVFCGVGPSTPITSAQRTTIIRSIRRLQALGVVHKSHRGVVGLTTQGIWFGRWLTSEWDGWKDYAAKTLVLPNY